MTPEKIELFDGYSVKVNTQLMDDFDFISDLSEAVRAQNVPELVSLYMALVGGEKTYQAVRAHIEKEQGYFSQKALLEIIGKVDELFPKGGTTASTRSWKTTTS